MKNDDKWTSLGVKEKLAIGTALAAFIAGWVLTGLACFVPLLMSEQSILWILGQAMVYTASVFGVTSYFSSETVRMRNDLKRMMDEERERIETEKENENDT
jgi:FtsH-binding integral membrane protein